MARGLVVAGFCMAFATAAAGPERTPVLVELFTSEGCSSCPPADATLGLLDSRAIVLSEHVDYWDRLGWRDRFSSEAFTQRQEAYAKGFGIEGPYTPQMVVDGSVQFNGSDGRRAAEAIEKSAKEQKASINLARTEAGIHIAVDGSPHDGDVYLALADNAASTEVRNGENKGRTLRHVAVVRSLRKIGGVRKAKSFSKDVDIPASADNQRIVVFVQEAGQSHVLGAAMISAIGH
jgi:hypothetical protein